LSSTINASNTGFGGIIQQGDSSGSLQLQTAGTTALTIDTSQNVGIGTTAPDALLHVNNASAKIRIGVTASSSYLDIYRDSTLGGSIYNAAQASPYGYHVWQTAGTERMRIDSSGNVLVTGGGGLGYGTGSGGSVTQATSKSTAVTLNKTSGQINTANSALGAGASVSFTVNNSLMGAADIVIVNSQNVNYTAAVNGNSAGSFSIILTNISAGSLSQVVTLQYVIIKGAIA